ncbi:MAG: hypothetical protein LBD30_01550 [Verrucomicrobiales bacterium]|nr:hypothetical protein [Verrucomicrobiales bacterium]
MGNWLLWRGAGRPDLSHPYELMVSLSASCVIIHLLLFVKIPLTRCPWWTLPFIAIAACYAIFLAGNFSGALFAMLKNEMFHHWRDLPLNVLTAVTVSGVGALLFTPVIMLFGVLEWLWLMALKYWR